jgi:hypothetical protein
VYTHTSSSFSTAIIICSSCHSTDHGASNESTLASLTDIAILNSLTTFFNSQDGLTSAYNLRSQVVDFVFKEHSIVWSNYDVERLYRAARKSASRIHNERAADEQTERRWKEREEEVAQQTTREGKKRKREEMPELYSKHDAMKKRGPHNHSSLVIAHVNVVEAMRAMRERGEGLKQEKDREKARQKGLQKKEAEEKYRAEKERKAKESAEKNAKAKAEREAAAAREAQTLRERNTNFIHGIALNRSKEWGEKRAQAAKLSNVIEMAEVTLKHTTSKYWQKGNKPKRSVRRVVKSRIECLEKLSK